MTENDLTPETAARGHEQTRLSPDDLLMRLAEALKQDIAPAVADEYTRTQTHMASVILQRVAKQVRLAPEHSETEAAQLADLVLDLKQVFGSSSLPEAVADGWQQLLASPEIDALGPLLRSLHRWDDPMASVALERIRFVLRQDIDRRMEIAS